MARNPDAVLPRTDPVGAAKAGTPAVPARSAREVGPPGPGVFRAVRDVWRHRAAFFYFLRHFMRKRYGRTFLGVLWLFLPVLLPLFLGALVFGGILGVSVPGVPYFLYFTVSLGAWTCFAQTAYFATRSIEISRSELARIYVPRLIPLAGAMTLPVITLFIYIALTLLATGFYVLERDEFYLQITPETLLVPVAYAGLVVFGLACGLWFSPLAARARDVRRLAGYVLGIWYFLTPVMYPIEEIPSGWRFLASLNPITAPIELYKQGLIATGEVTPLGVGAYFVALVVASVVGLRIFLPKERRDCVHY
jgi:lipopolysaccharide transport system permease protein